MKNVQLSDKTVLTFFSVSRWGGHKFDRKATEEVHKSNSAKSDAGNYSKRLLPSGSTDKIDTIVNAARDYHKTYSLPWFSDGTRILPANMYSEYAQQMKEYRQEFESEIKAFFVTYPKLIEDSRSRMGKLFNKNDYPTVDQIKTKYGWELNILPFPDASDFRVESQVPELDAVRKEMQKRMNGVWEEALKDMGERIAEVVGRMSERLKSYKPGREGKRAEGTFKDSLVDNVSKLVELLPQFNLADDPKLAKIIKKMNDELCKHNADALRDDPKIRKKVAASADAVLSSLSDFMG